MNSLTILVLIVVGVVVAYLLEELLEGKDIEIFSTSSHISGYGPWKGGHLFSAFPEGWFTDKEVLKQEKEAVKLWLGVSIMVTLSLLWILINVPELFKTATVYCFLYTLALMIAMTEIMMPVKTWITAMPRHKGIYGSGADIAIGVFGGFGFVFLIEFLSGAGFGVVWAVERIPHGLIMSLWMVGLCIPVAEEYLFNKLVATGIENYGVVPGILGMSVLVWILFHFSVYGLAGPMVAVLLLFGLYRGFVLLKTKAFIATIIAHVIVNSAMVFIAMG